MAHPPSTARKRSTPLRQIPPLREGERRRPAQHRAAPDRAAAFPKNKDDRRGGAPRRLHVRDPRGSREGDQALGRTAREKILELLGRGRLLRRDVPARQTPSDPPAVKDARRDADPRALPAPTSSASCGGAPISRWAVIQELHAARPADGRAGELALVSRARAGSAPRGPAPAPRPRGLGARTAGASRRASRHQQIADMIGTSRETVTRVPQGAEGPGLARAGGQALPGGWPRRSDLDSARLRRAERPPYLLRFGFASLPRLPLAARLCEEARKAKPPGTAGSVLRNEDGLTCRAGPPGHRPRRTDPAHPGANCFEKTSLQAEREQRGARSEPAGERMQIRWNRPPERPRTS